MANQGDEAAAKRTGNIGAIVTRYIVKDFELDTPKNRFFDHPVKSSSPLSPLHRSAFFCQANTLSAGTHPISLLHQISVLFANVSGDIPNTLSAGIPSLSFCHPTFDRIRLLLS